MKHDHPALILQRMRPDLQQPARLIETQPDHLPRIVILNEIRKPLLPRRLDVPGTTRAETPTA